MDVGRKREILVIFLCVWVGWSCETRVLEVLDCKFEDEEGWLSKGIDRRAAQ
jgi:hypothetical protein